MNLLGVWSTIMNIIGILQGKPVREQFRLMGATYTK